MAENTLQQRAERFLVQCGPCDGGLPMGCACPNDDPRPVIADLLDEIETLTAQRDQAERRHERLESAIESLVDEWDAADEYGNPLRKGSLGEAADELRALLPGGGA